MIAVTVKGAYRTRPVVVVEEEGVLGDMPEHPARELAREGAGWDEQGLQREGKRRAMLGIRCRFGCCLYL